jgi:hypothetical protein
VLRDEELEVAELIDIFKDVAATKSGVLGLSKISRFRKLKTGDLEDLIPYRDSWEIRKTDEN